MTGTERNTMQDTAEGGVAGVQPTEPGAAPAQPSDPATEAADAPDLQQQLAAAQEEVARLKDEYLRALAETENLRRRAARERQETSQYAITGFARDLLSVADNLNRALGAVAGDARRADSALDALMSGVEMTEKELLTIFERHGVKPIPAVGALFDPHVHEALFEMPDPSVPQGTVLQVMQPGYSIHGRTLRPARVGLARGGPKPGAAAAQTDAGKADAEAPSMIAEEDGVIEYPSREGAYRKSADAGTAGTRLDEDT